MVSPAMVTELFTMLSSLRSQVEQMRQVLTKLGKQQPGAATLPPAKEASPASRPAGIPRSRSLG